MVAELAAITSSDHRWRGRVRTIVSVRSCDCGIQGPENLILTLARQLGPRGIRYVIVNLWDGSPARVELHEEADRLGLESSIVRSAWGLDPRTTGHLRTLFKRLRPDVIETHDVKSQTFSLLASHGLGIPLVGHFYGQLVTRSLWLRAQELSSFVTLRLFDRVLANSRAQQAELLRARFPADRVEVVPSFVETDKLLPPSPTEVAAARQRLGIDAGRPVLSTIARLSPNKGHAYMLRALPTIRDRVPNVLYLIAGEGDSHWRGEGGVRGELERLTDEFGIRDSVTFLGYYPDLRTILNATDIVVSPSLREGMQVSLLEAMSAGRAIVATAIGGTPDAIDDGRSGLLVPPADPAAMAEAVSRVLVDGDSLRALGAAARRRAVEVFDAAAVADQVLQICERVGTHA